MTGGERAEAPVGGAARGRGLPIAAFALGALAVGGCGAGLALALARGPLATSLARTRLEALGVRCDERFSVEPSLDFASARIAPTRCELVPTTDAGPTARSPLEALELPEGADVALVALRPVRVRASSVRVALAEDAPGGAVDLGALGPIAALVSLPSRVASGAHAAAALARLDLPDTAVDEVTIALGDAPRARLREVSLAHAEAAPDSSRPLTLAIAEAALLSLDGPLGTRAEATLTTLHGEATPARCTLTGALRVEASVPLIGTLARDTPITLTATGLDTDTPRYDVAF